jgi:hypothetical protein
VVNQRFWVPSGFREPGTPIVAIQRYPLGSREVAEGTAPRSRGGERETSEAVLGVLLSEVISY